MSKLPVFKPGFRYPSISITGNTCWLNCSHCRGRFLNAMIQIKNPVELLDFVERNREKLSGLLISGGFNKQGYLPVENYLTAIKLIRERYSLIMSIHPGFMNSELINELRKTSIDIVDYELILDPVVIKEVKNLDKIPGDYISVYEEFVDQGFYTVPHLVIGLGELKWIYEAINYLTTTSQEHVVFLIHMDSTAETWINALNVLKQAGGRLNCGIVLGCMRPFGFKKKIDKVIIENNLVDRIVNPLRETIENKEIIVYETCCSIPQKKLIQFNKNSFSKNLSQTPY